MSPLHHALSSSLPWYKKWHETKHHSLAHYGFLIVFLALTAGLLFSSPTAHAAGTTYYVSSSTGNDSNTGTTTTTPWKSLTKVSATTFKAGDSILFMRGDTFTGTLTVTTSGTSTAPITYGAYGTGANPVISGFTQATGWTSIGTNLWESSNQVSTLPTVNMVTVNGVNTAMGRYPNSGYLTYQSGTTTTITSSSLNSSTNNWTGAEMVLRKNNYTLDRTKITNHSGTTVTYSDSITTDTPAANFGFFIQNDLRTVDSQNEWYYNPTTHKIDIYSTSTPTNVQVASVNNLVSDNGNDYVTIDSINFTVANGDAISFTGATDNCTVQNTTISFAGNDGIETTGGNGDIFNNNTIANSGKAGIFILGTNGKVTNNTISNSGIVPGQADNGDQGSGIFTVNDGALVQYNTLTNSGGHGIYANGLTTTVKNNFLNYSVVLMNDDGGIYTAGNKTAITIDGNIVLNTMGNLSGTTGSNLAEGIYIDELGSAHATVTNNTVAYSGNSGIKIHKNSNDVINGNTIYNNSHYQIYFQNEESTPRISGESINNNIFFSGAASQYVLGFVSITNDIANFGVANNNYYARPIDDNLSFTTYQTNTNYVSRNLASWQSFSGQDSSSHTSPKTITTTNDLDFEYNASNSPKTVALPGGSNYVDVKNVTYPGTITLAPWTSAVLIKGTGTAGTSGTYYISPTGNDTTGTGSSSAPWKTLAKACTAVTTSGNTIHVNAGTYTETAQCNLAIGVSIVGEGTTSHIISHYVSNSVYDAAVVLNSTTEGTNGNQSISNLELDGDNLTSYSAIIVHGRSNVIVHDVTILNFNSFGISFNGRTGTYGTPPSVYATGNQLYNSVITNSTSRLFAGGLILMSGQKDIAIHDNVFTETTRPQGTNGDVIYAIEGNNEGLKYYNNKSYKPNDDGVQTSQEWNMGIESWTSTGGMEIYGNEFHGGGQAIDAGGPSTKGTYPYSWYIHDNLFMMDTQLPTTTYRVSEGVNFERTAQDAIISNNHFKNLPFGIEFSLNTDGAADSGISIHNNLFENMGFADGSYGFMIFNSPATVTPAPVLSDISVDNNTMIGGTTGHTWAALYLDAAGVAIQNINFRNNIVENIGKYGYLTFDGTGTLNNVVSQNNILFNNVDTNVILKQGTPTITNLTNTGNAIANPLLDSTFHLQSTSPAIDTGTNVGFAFNGTAPDIGAYESTGTTDTTPPTISLTAPTNGSIISGNATLTATASDNVAVASVSFYADTTLISTDTTAPYQATLNTLTLSPGTHTIKATASDAAGNTASSSASVTIQGADTTAPSVALTSPTGGTVSGTITPTATATDNVAVASVAFKVDTTLIATDTTSPYTATLNTTTLSDGLHTIQAIATDTSGNTNTASVIVTVANTPVDTTPPTVSITAPSNNATLSGTTAFSATAGDNVAVASVSFYADNTLIATDTTAPYTTSIIPSSLAIGTHTLKATATDTSGNSTSASITVSVPDTTLPTVSLTSPTSGSVSGTITIQATASDNIAVSKVLFYADTTLLATDTAAPYTATLDTTTLAIGTHTLKATASDAAGNTASSTVSVTIPDQTPPTVSLTAPTPGATLSGNATLSATATDNVAVASVAFYDGSTLISSDTTAPYTTSWNTTTTSPGIHTLSAIAKDAAGNATTSATISVTVKDQSAPTVSITAPTGGTQLSGTTTILATASDNVAVDHVDFYQGTTLIGADATAPYSITWDTSAVANASYTLKAIAYDATGNATTAATVSVTVYNVQNVPDTWAPTVSITAPTAGSTINGTTTLTAAAADTLGTTHSGVASVSFYRGTTLIDTDTTASPNYNITWNTTLVADGSYTLKAIATDASGNSTTSTTVTVTVKNADTTPPTVVISSPANNATIIGMTTIAATASDNIAVSKVLFYADTTLLATDTAAPYTTTLDATTLAPGLHTLKATASDAAGNTATATVSVSVTSVDTTPPTLSFTYPTQGNLVPKGSAVSLVISATDNTAVASVAMYVGSTKLCTATTLTNGYYSCTWNVPPKKGFFGFLNVKYTLKAIATDTSGNTKTVSESVTAS